MNQISKPVYYVKTYDDDICITAEQRTILFMAMDKEAKYFDVDDKRIMMSQIKSVVPASEYTKSPTGGFYCQKHPTNFIAKGKICGYC